jgi:hypothetical protein
MPWYDTQQQTIGDTEPLIRPKDNPKHRRAKKLANPDWFTTSRARHDDERPVTSVKRLVYCPARLNLAIPSG